MGRILLFVAAILVAVQSGAQSTGGSSVWLGTVSISQSGQEREELIYVGAEAWAQMGPIRAAMMAEGTGASGQFRHDDPKTYRSAKIAVGIDWPILRIQDASCGPLIAGEYSALLEDQDGEVPLSPNAATFGLGGTCWYRGAAVHSVLGPNQNLTGWFSSTTRVKVPAGWTTWRLEAALGERQQVRIEVIVAARYEWGGKK